MDIIHYMLDLYFAAVLVTAGIAKIDDYQSFVRALSIHKIPPWGIPAVKTAFPWIEILLGLSLQIASGTSYEAISSMLIFLLFAFFK